MKIFVIIKITNCIGLVFYVLKKINAPHEFFNPFKKIVIQIISLPSKYYHTHNSNIVIYSNL